MGHASTESTEVYAITDAHKIHFIVQAATLAFDGKEIDLDKLARQATKSEIQRVKGLLYDR